MIKRFLGAVLLLVPLGVAMALRDEKSWPYWLGILAPDLSLVIGYSHNLENGVIRKKAVPIYNTVHSPLLPLVMILASLGNSNIAMGVSLGWLSHIGLDWIFGFGKRNSEGALL